MRLPEQSEANFFYFFRQKNFKCTKNTQSQNQLTKQN